MTARTLAELAAIIPTFETGNPDNITALKTRDYYTDQNDSYVSVFSPSWVLEGSFPDFTTQSGTSDVPATVLIGDAKTSINGHVNVDAGGIVTFVNTGAYLLKVRGRIARSVALGVSEMFIWTEASIDGGAVFFIVPEIYPVSGNLYGVADDRVLSDVSNIFATAGLKVRTRFARSSSGGNAGDLVPLAPSAGLKAAAPGLPDVPSALLEVFTIPTNQYVEGTSGVLTITLNTGGTTTDLDGSVELETAGSDGRGCVLDCQITAGTISAINSVKFKGIDYKALDALTITGPNFSVDGTATVDTIG